MALDITTMAGFPRYSAAVAALSTAQSNEDAARATAATAQTALDNASKAVDTAVKTRVAARAELAVATLALRTELTAALAPVAQSDTGSA